MTKLYRNGFFKQIRWNLTPNTFILSAFLRWINLYVQNWTHSQSEQNSNHSEQRLQMTAEIKSTAFMTHIVSRILLTVLNSSTVICFFKNGSRILHNSYILFVYLHLTTTFFTVHTVILPFIPNTKAIGSIQQTVLSLWSSFEEPSLKGGLREL